MQDGGNDRLAKPAQTKRNNRYAQLRDGERDIKPVHKRLRIGGAAVAGGDQHIETRTAHLDDGEFRRDKKSIAEHQ